MANRLFRVEGGKIDHQLNMNAREVKWEPYKLESDLEKLIVDNPELIFRGDDYDRNGELILVTRQFGVSEVIGGDDKFSLDILFLDQDGIPVLVEVKRSTDTRIKREVVGQMIDYAARVSTWDAEKLKEKFRENNPEGTEIRRRYDNDTFWRRVADNLKAEQIKLVFAADELPSSLQDMIRFLDRLTPGVEVYGVEIRQHPDGGHTYITTGVVAENAQRAKAVKSESNMLWSLEEFTISMRNLGLIKQIPVVEEFYRFAVEDLKLTFVAGTGNKYAKLIFKLSSGGMTLFNLDLYRKGETARSCFEFYIDSLQRNLSDSSRYKNKSAKDDRKTGSAGSDPLQKLFADAFKENGQSYLKMTPQAMTIDLRLFQGSDKNLQTMERLLCELKQEYKEMQ